MPVLHYMLKYLLFCFFTVTGILLLIDDGQMFHFPLSVFLDTSPDCVKVTFHIGGGTYARSWNILGERKKEEKILGVLSILS